LPSPLFKFGWHANSNLGMTQAHQQPSQQPVALAPKK
jgi:hypothetical protein